MTFFACPKNDFELWDYIQGDIYDTQLRFEGQYRGGSAGNSILNQRYQFLHELNSIEEIKIALKNNSNDYWTKWLIFPHHLLTSTTNQYNQTLTHLTTAIDVHRSMLSNEIIIESDYPTYKKNYEATKLIGQILENKGYKPHYYYSGNKSIHIHVYFDWKQITQINPHLKGKLAELSKNSTARLKKQWITWLRTLLITCFNTKAKTFDTDLIKNTHLIRCELSKNKKGFKTFIGYTHKDTSTIPLVCNEQNKIQPRLAKIQLSKINNFEKLITQFINETEDKNKKIKRIKYNQSLTQWTNHNKKELKNCVKFLLTNEFTTLNDGKKRGYFILLNEIKKHHTPEQTNQIINNWAIKNNYTINQNELNKNLNKKSYYLTHNYIHSFYHSIKYEIEQKCKHKI